MIGEMMPYVRKYAPEMRIYAVVWHTKKDNWRGIWQCGVFQKFKTRKDGKPSPQYGPYHVICTNCPNALDRQITRGAGGEYWMYRGYYAVRPRFSIVRFAVGLEGARHETAVTYMYADKRHVHNVKPDQDVAGILRSDWICGEAQANYYLAKDPASRKIDYAIASHGTLAARHGITDRKYVETLRVLAHEKKSAADIQFIKTIGARIANIGGKRAKGGVDNFSGSVEDESGAQKLRREIAERIKRLVKGKE
jgi:hypothetical protein